MARQPLAIGLMLCERVIIEENTRHVSIISRFRRLEVDSFPASLSFTAFAILTSGEGRMNLSLRVTRLDSLEEVRQVDKAIIIPDRLAEVRVIFRVKACPVPVAGSYAVTLHAGEDEIAHAKFAIFLSGG